jgi:hypothetical protein
VWGERPRKGKAKQKCSGAVFAVEWSSVNGELDSSIDLSASPLAATQWHGKNKSKSRALEGGDLQKTFLCPQTKRKIFCKYYPSLDLLLSVTVVESTSLSL